MVIFHFPRISIYAIMIKMKEEKKSRAGVRAIIHSLLFILGFSIVFTSLGLIAGVFPHILHSYRRILSIAAGLVLILFGIHLSGLFRIFALEREFRLLSPDNSKGYMRTLLVGVGFAAGWTPCIGPILAGIFALAAGTAGDMIESLVLFALFSLGIGIPFFLSALAIGYFFQFFNRFKKFIKYVEITAGIILIVVGILLITDSMTSINARLLSITPEISIERSIFERHGLSFSIAFLGGLLAFLSPCVLPLVPSYIAYITGVSVEELGE